MKKSTIKTGEVYQVKVSGKLADVHIVGGNPHGGWDGINLATNKQVRIKSGARLRKPVSEKAKEAAKAATKTTTAAQGLTKEGDLSVNKIGVKVGLVYSVQFGGGRLWARIDKEIGDGKYAATTMPNGKPITTTASKISGDGRTVDDWNTSRTLKKKELPAEVDKLVDDAKAGTHSKKTVQSAAKKPKQGGLDGAVKVLEEAGEPLNCQEMVKRMLDKGYWKTDGKTPSATIYSAILREIKEKGADARFRKTERGKFALAAK